MSRFSFLAPFPYLFCVYLVNIPNKNHLLTYFTYLFLDLQYNWRFLILNNVPIFPNSFFCTLSHLNLSLPYSTCHYGPDVGPGE